MFRNIIFDWSGTLNDEIKTSYAANMLVFERFGADRIPFERYKEEFELPYINWYRRYFPGIEPDRIHDAYVSALDHVQKPRCFPWAESLLTDLHNDGRKMAILSALHLGTLKLLVNEHGFDGFFIKVEGGILDKRKAVKGLMTECGFRREETVFVGDMMHDIEAGRIAGVKTVGVAWGYDSRKKLEREKPDFLVENIEELRNILLTRT